MSAPWQHSIHSTAAGRSWFPPELCRRLQWLWRPARLVPVHSSTRSGSDAAIFEYWQLRMPWKMTMVQRVFVSWWPSFFVERCWSDLLCEKPQELFAGASKTSSWCKRQKSVLYLLRKSGGDLSLSLRRKQRWGYVYQTVALVEFETLMAFETLLTCHTVASTLLYIQKN